MTGKVEHSHHEMVLVNIRGDLSTLSDLIAATRLTTSGDNAIAVDLIAQACRRIIAGIDRAIDEATS